MTPIVLPFTLSVLFAEPRVGKMQAIRLKGDPKSHRNLRHICYLLAGLLMIENTYNFLLPLFLDYVRDGLNAYLIYTMNKWVVVLLVAAVLEVYTTHRMSNELEKEAKKR